MNTSRHFLFKKYVIEHNNDFLGKKKTEGSFTKLSHYFNGYEDAYHSIYLDKTSDKQFKLIMNVFKNVKK